MSEFILGHYNYWIVILLMMIGFYTGNVRDATTPIIAEGFTQYSNPLPHVLILTAIVVGVSTTALGLALVVRIREAYGSIEEEDIHAQDKDASL